MTFSRLKKAMYEYGLLSKRKVDLLIKQGLVTLNGRKEGKWRELNKNEWISLLDWKY